jgi:SNF2 family DNA or RNA helicase
VQDNREIREELIAVYENLSPFERYLLQLCSVIYEPTNKTTIFKCLGKTDTAFSEEEITSVKALTPYLSKLEALKLLNGVWQCHGALVEVVSRRAVMEGHYKSMAKAIQEENPLRKNFYGNSVTYCSRVMRDLRIGVYTHNAKLYDECHSQLYSHCPNDYTRYNPLVRICNNPFDADWFRSLPVELQAHSLTQLFYHAILHLEDDNEALAYALDEDLMNLIPESERYSFFYFLVSRFIAGGRLTEARRLIPQIEDSDYTGGLMGWIHFLEGNNDRAIESYEADLKELRRRSGRRNIYFNGVAGLFFILALIKRQDALLQKTIDKYIDAALSSRYGNPLLASAYSSLKAISCVQHCEPEAARIVIKADGRDNNSLSVFFSTLANYWLDNRLSKSSIDELSQIFIKAREIDLNWLAMECAELLCLAEQQTPIRRNYINKIREKTGMVSIVSMIKAEEPWQKSLRALIQATSPDRQSVSRSHKTRLIWLVTYHGSVISLQPREQKLAVRGTWTKGRPVALSKLYGGKNLDYLTKQDQMICAAIKKAVSSFWGTSYYIDMEKALPALVGHPLLFLSKPPSVSVEFVKGEPEVTVTESGSSLNIHFYPEILDRRTVMVRETPTRFKVIELSEDHRRIARILGEKGLSVPISACDQVSTAIAGISSLMTVHSAIVGKAKDIEEIQADPSIHLHLLPSGSGVRLEMFVKPFTKGGPYLKPGIGTENVIAEIDGSRMQTRRNLELEEQKAREVEDSCPTLSVFAETDRQWFLDEPEDCLQVLLDLKALQDKKKVIVEWPEGEKLKVSHEASFEQFHLRIRGKTDWFEVSGELRLDENLVLDMKGLLDLLQQTNSRFIPLGEGQFIALTREFRKRLEELDVYSEKRGKKMGFHPLAALAMEDFTERLLHLDADKVWKARLQTIKDGLEFTTVVPSTLKTQLRDYQIEGYQWLARLAYLRVGACLADDMGLGKTLQALAIILDRAPRGPTLVVAPTSVCMNWITEANRFAPTLNLAIFGGQDRESLVKSLKGFDVLVCSYSLLQQEAELLTSREWHTIVLDEAQAIKNITTKRSQAAMNLKGEFKLITTGTPIENHLGEFWTLFNFINPGLLGSREKFNERFAIPIEKNHNRDAQKQLKKLVRPFILRRIKSQVLDELPPCTEILLQVEMTPEEVAFYEALRQQALERLEKDETPLGQKHLRILAEIMKLRRACCNPRLIISDSDLPSSKLELFGELVSELLENRHKALVYSQFVRHLTLIREYLDERKINYQYLDGSTPPRERKRQVDTFQAGEGDLFLISLKAGGLGLNLTAATYVIHMDPWWNPAVEDQASDRAHRIGQQYPVTIYRLLTKNTIEEKIVRLHQEKRDLASSLLDGSDISGKVSAEELLRLIKEH